MDERVKLTRSRTALFWSITFPGFGQFYNQQFIKGAFFIFLEFLVNLQGEVNRAIIYSFHGEFSLASEVANWNWLLFYPCIYIFGAAESYYQAHLKENQSFAGARFIPFILAAMVGTIGTIYGLRWGLGPIFNGLIGMGVGAIIGRIAMSWIDTDIDTD